MEGRKQGKKEWGGRVKADKGQTKKERKADGQRSCPVACPSHKKPASTSLARLFNARRTELVRPARCRERSPNTHRKHARTPSPDKGDPTNASRPPRREVRLHGPRRPAATPATAAEGGAALLCRARVDDQTEKRPLVPTELDAAARTRPRRRSRRGETLLYPSSAVVGFLRTRMPGTRPRETEQVEHSAVKHRVQNNVQDRPAKDRPAFRFGSRFASARPVPLRRVKPSQRRSTLKMAEPSGPNRNE